MKYDLEPIITDNLKKIYGLSRENINYLYRYLCIRTSVFHNKRKVTSRDLFRFVVEELNLTIFNEEEDMPSYFSYEGEKYSTFEVSSDFIDNLFFRAEIEGDIDYREDLENVFKEGYRKAYKFRGLPSYKSHLMLLRLEALNEMYGADPIYSEGIEGFGNDINHNPFKRSLEERLNVELDSSNHSESNTTSYITEEDLEDYLVENIELIEDGLKFIRRQVDVPGGFIDILAKDSNGNFCVIEIKTNEDKSIIWQTLHYPKEIKNMYNSKNVRMMTIVPNYSKPIHDVLKSIGNVETFDYDIKVVSGNIANLKINKC